MIDTTDIHTATNLLNDTRLKLSALQEARSRFSAQLAPEFSIFDYLRNDEMGLSSCIASLLNPKGTHGQDRIFLELFLKSIGDNANWAKGKNVTRTETEKVTNGLRRIDVFIGFENGVIGIENKPWAVDQDKQLSDYADYLEKYSTNGNWLLVYFGNSDPSEYSISPEKIVEIKGHYHQLNYRLLSDWLDACAGKCKSLVVRIFIEELIKYIRININREPDMSESVELKKLILSTENNLESAFHLSNSMIDVKRELMAIFRNDLDSALKKLNFTLLWNTNLDTNWVAHIGFAIEFHRSHKVLLKFQFEASGLYNMDWGVCLKDNGVIDATKFKKIKECMDAEFRVGKSSGEKWPWYLSNLTEDVGTPLRNWGDDPAPWVMIKNKELVNHIIRIAERVNNALIKAGDAVI